MPWNKPITVLVDMLKVCAISSHHDLETAVALFYPASGRDYE